ncbi:RNase H family protein [Vibrio echinoideorum]|uniref:RNase H family protein n=1 Tax=Vibrio echinoideorum TaxID=2100116 RepID=A0ABU9FW90_9VIBR
MNEENCGIYIAIAISKDNTSNLQGGIGISVYKYDEQLVDESNLSIGGVTDSSELELIALIEAMAYTRDGDCLYSSSEYCVKGFNEWLDNWKEKGVRIRSGTLSRWAELGGWQGRLFKRPNCQVGN